MNRTVKPRDLEDFKTVISAMLAKNMTTRKHEPYKVAIEKVKGPRCYDAFITMPEKLPEGDMKCYPCIDIELVYNYYKQQLENNALDGEAIMGTVLLIIQMIEENEKMVADMNQSVNGVIKDPIAKAILEVITPKTAEDLKKAGFIVNKVCGLYVTYRAVVTSNKERVNTYVIREKELETSGISIEDLHTQAADNLPCTFSGEIKSTVDVMIEDLMETYQSLSDGEEKDRVAEQINELIAFNEETQDEDPLDHLYEIKCHVPDFSSAMVFCKEFMKSLCSLFGCDLYLAFVEKRPNIFRVTSTGGKKDIVELLEKIAQTPEMENATLSNNLFRVSAATGELTIEETI